MTEKNQKNHQRKGGGSSANGTDNPKNSWCYKDIRKAKTISKVDLLNVKNDNSSTIKSSTSRVNQFQNSTESNSEIRWNFRNSLKIKLVSSVRIEDIIEAIGQVIVNIKNVTAISQYKNNKTWIVTLNDSLKCEDNCDSVRLFA